MTTPRQRFDGWSLATYALWQVVFLGGLNPEGVYQNLRDLAWVATVSAWVNSPHVLTIAGGLFVGWFAYTTCRAAGLSPSQTQARSVQAGLLGVIAFLPLVNRREMPFDVDVTMAYVIVVSMVAKLMAWLYLQSLLFRYHVLGNAHAFALMTSPFPSAHERRPAARPGHAHDSTAREPASLQGAGDDPGA